MPRRKQSPRRLALEGPLRRGASFFTRLGGWIRRALHRWRHPVAIEVLIADPARRRSLERNLRETVRRLDVLMPLPDELPALVLVQQVIHTDTRLIGAVEEVHATGRRRINLIRLPLQVNGTRLSIDEVLAALAEQWVYLVAPDSQRVGIRAVVETAAKQTGPSPVAFRPDPLAVAATAQDEQPAGRAA